MNSDGMLCPDCKGAGKEIASHVHYADGTGAFNMPMRCNRCGGAGLVSKEMESWIEAGRKLREARMTLYRTLREEAKRRGLDVVTLSKMEQGKIKPVAG